MSKVRDWKSLTVLGVVCLGLLFPAVGAAQKGEKADKNQKAPKNQKNQKVKDPKAAKDKNKGPNATPPEGSTEAKSSPAAKQTSDWAMAQALVAYGREHKSAEALITAAKVLAGISAEELEGEPKVDKNPDASEGADEKSSDAPDNSPAALLKEAKGLAGENATLVALADDVAALLEETARGAEGGPKIDVDRLPAFSTMTYTIRFVGNEVAAIAVNGDHTTDLDLYVYDENGGLIAADDDNTDTCVVRWVPRWTGKFTVRVVNRGIVYNDYALLTN